MTLRDRCKAFYQQAQRDAMLRQGSLVDDLQAFVLAEKGRSADWSLEDTKPLVLYFANDKDRTEFVAAVHADKPDMIAKEMP